MIDTSRHRAATPRYKGWTERKAREKERVRERERERGFKAFQLFDRPIELYAWKRISIGTRIGGAERMKERE